MIKKTILLLLSLLITNVAIAEGGNFTVQEFETYQGSYDLTEKGFVEHLDNKNNHYYIWSKNKFVRTKQKSNIIDITFTANMSSVPKKSRRFGGGLKIPEIVLNLMDKEQDTVATLRMFHNDEVYQVYLIRKGIQDHNNDLFFVITSGMNKNLRIAFKSELYNGRVDMMFAKDLTNDGLKELVFGYTSVGGSGGTGHLTITSIH